ncbi:VC0807 family protein [Paenibacillus naphthalenovorans]|uniref:VC0807 family protein n=1 Tax=Paenibacillus naphthalenovorans TaxID=162209 RepID=UPI003D2A8311
MDRKRVIRGIFISLFINGGLPVLVFKVLENHMSEVAALSIATLIPLIDTLVHLLKHKKLDVFAAFMATGFILSIAAVLLGGDQKLILLRESFVTGIMGLLFLGSLILSKPLIYYLPYDLP